MNTYFGENEAKNLLNDIFNIACGAFEFINDINFQSENRTALQSGKAWSITYRLGRTEERYEGAILLCDTIGGIATRISNSNTPVAAPIMQRTYRQEYAECMNCHRPVMASVTLQDYYWKLPPAPVKCYDCNRLESLTNAILIYAGIKRRKKKLLITYPKNALIGLRISLGTMLTK